MILHFVLNDKEMEVMQPPAAVILFLLQQEEDRG